MFTKGAEPAREERGAEPETKEYRTVERVETAEPDGTEEPPGPADAEIVEEELETEETDEVGFEDEPGPEEDWDEDWDEDYEEEPEDGEEPEPDGAEDEAGGAVEETKPGAVGQWVEEIGARFAELRDRASARWKDGLRRVGDIRLPHHELDGQKVLLVAGVVLTLSLVGAAGYVLGKGAGEDVDSARLEGEYRGRKAGAVEGATKGYAAGFKKGRDAAFEKAYRASYIRNYRRAYEKAGMEVPKPKDIEVPEP